MRQSPSLLPIGLLLFLTLAVACAQSGPTAGAPPPAPPEADMPVRGKMVWAGSYGRDIQPILNQYCVECHGANRTENGLRLDTYEGVMQGTQHGKVVVGGSPGTSTLLSVVDGSAAPQISMPQGHRRLTPNRVENIRLWIEAGAKND